MDFRHYDTRSYWLCNYEGFPDPGACADWIATTSECSVKLTDKLPDQAAVHAFMNSTRKPAVYVGDPKYYH